MNALSRLMNAFMPRVDDPELRSRFQFAVQSWFIAWPLAVVWTVASAFQGLWLQLVFNGVMVVLGPVTVLGMKRTRTLAPWFHLTLVGALLLYGPGVLGQTPPDETALFFSVIIPLVAGFLFGWRSALIWAVLTAVVSITALMFALSGYTLPAIDPTPRLSKALNIISALMMAAVFASRFHEVRRSAQERADGANRAKSLFLASISHEIRTPMNGVLGMTEVLLQETKDPVLREQLEVIHRSGALMVRLINDLLDVTRLEANKLTLDAQSFDLRALLLDVHQLFAPQAREKGVTFEVVLPDGPAMRLGDALRLRQVLFNLAHNAVKFTERGSVQLRARASGELVEFLMQDTGIGIAGEVQGRLFSVFEQGDASTTRRYGGTGLGLALCRQLVALMGGSLNMVSELGKGSTFSFALRLPEGVPAPVPETIVCANRGVERVLVVDDNPINLKVATSLVRKAGYEVDAVESGAAAIAAATTTTYAAVLMDCHMPDMDGFEATRRIRNLPPPHGLVRIIALTASTSDEDLASARKSGMNEVLSKPVSLDALHLSLSRRGEGRGEGK